LPALPIISGTFRCAISQSIGSSRIANVVHVQAPGTPTAAAVAAEVAFAWGKTGGFSVLQSTQLAYLNVHCTPLDGSSPSVDHDFSLANHVGGTQAASSVPVNVALVVSLLTNTRGRSKRGRMYIPGIVQTQVDIPAAKWSSGTLTAAVTEWNVWQAQLLAGASLLKQVVASYKLATAFPITSVVAKADFGTQRDRAKV
jgi:hypothetical protein